MALLSVETFSSIIETVHFHLTPRLNQPTGLSEAPTKEGIRSIIYFLLIYRLFNREALFVEVLSKCYAGESTEKGCSLWMTDLVLQSWQLNFTADLGVLGAYISNFLTRSISKTIYWSYHMIGLLYFRVSFNHILFLYNLEDCFLESAIMILNIIKYYCLARTLKSTKRLYIRFKTPLKIS